MYKNKKDVDKHVKELSTKLSVKEFKTRAYSVARLYFEVGDYTNCQKYVEQYLTQKDNNAAAYRLLGQALQKMGLKDKALEQFKISLDIDQTQTSTILDICELLADDDVTIEPGRAKYWFEKAEATFPKHPVTFRLRERLVTMSDPDPEALVELLTMELKVRPKDPLLHARVLKHYLNVNQFEKAFEHSYNIEFSSNNFPNHCAWYEILDEILKHDLKNIDKWSYQLLLLTVKERICLLSLTETPSGLSKSLVESADLLHAYDQALVKVAAAKADPGFAEFHTNLLQHHRGQIAFHAATLLLKRAKKDLISWSDATKPAASLMLLAWQTVPLDSKVNWLRNAPENQLKAVNRWYSEGTYRCSQSGHYLITNFQDKNQSLLDQISQCCSGTHWKHKLYEKVYTSKAHLGKIQSSHFTSNAFSAPQLRLPRKLEVEAYDCDAQKEYGNSLHYFVWTLLNYKNYAHFKCTLFDMLTPTVTSCGPETLNKLDIYAFLYCAALTTRQKKSNHILYIHGEKPNVLPANITDLLCPLAQMKWWDCAYKFSQNLLGSELTDIRVTLSRGIEVVRCTDNHGLDPELLCFLGRIFSERAKVTTSVEEKNFIEIRACLYYKSAITLLEKLKSKIMIKVSDKRLFDYTHQEIGTKQLNLLIEESKLFVAVNYINDGEYEKAIEMLSSLKSQQAYYHLAQAYKKLAIEESTSLTDGSKSYGIMLSKAKNYAYKALDLLKDNETNKSLPLYSDTQELIEDIEICMNKIDPDLSRSINNIEGNYSSDENVSYRTSIRRSNSYIFRNISSTPKATLNQNNTNYRTAIDSQILETTRLDQRHFERIENEIKNLQKRDSTITDFMEQTRSWFDENRNLGNKIINTINSNIQNTTDQFKQLKISVDHVKDQIDECRNECKDVGDLKNQIAELKKEVNKLKKTSSEQTFNESDLYNLDRTNETTSNYGAQLPFTPQMFQGFNQRQPFPVPPNPYQLYNQTLYNLYNQYSQFASSVPSAQPLFDPTRAQMNFPGIYPTPDQMFLDMAHLIPPAASAAPPAAVPTMPVPHSVPVGPTAPSVPIVSAPPLAGATSVFAPKSTSSTSDLKDTSRSLPVNVVITSSDPLPTIASTSGPVLSVTIPQKHIKTNQPHNYQIAMPTSTKTNQDSSSPVFSFSMPESKNNPVSFSKAFQRFSGEDSPLYKALHGDTSFDGSKTVVDGPFAGASPNTSLNKSRTLSEKSNTSVDYDPCPDFKPIVPLPAEVKVTTGEEDEMPIFASRAKLFRFVDKQWKERGLGEMKLLKHKTTSKVRVLMRREQVHKVCANHIITPEMEINPMKNETKAYIWVANDFAEETVVLEKFCIRFKTADIAKQFYEIFEKARQESESSSTKTDHKPTPVTKESKNTLNSNQSTIQNATVPVTAASSQGKTVIGGFTFSSTPIFKHVESEKETEAKVTNPESNKSNIFGNLTFKTGATTPFSNLFNTTTPAAITKTSNMVTSKNTTDTKLNTSDTVEEFEPTIDFKPVIALPALVEQKTGEEDETALFEHRAKLLRYDSSTKEWKERGLGNIKLLARNDNYQKVRLLMRREQIMKICCNHVLTKEMTFQKMPNMDKAVTWCAKDFSEGELVAETFCLRFKTVQLCDEFMNAIQTAQSNMQGDTKASKEEENVSKLTNETGFGDKFKAKAGSWYCHGCYTNNLETFAKCACCEQPKPQDNTSKVEKPAQPPKSFNWGDKFKPKPGSWECQSCCVRNEGSSENCSACNSPKDPTNKSKPTIAITSDTKVNFSFGIPQQPAASIKIQPKTEIAPKTVTPATTATSGFGDKFKPKEGSWECQQCFVRNASGSEDCCACNSPQDPNAPKKTSTIFDTAPTSIKFRFGIPPTLTNEDKQKPVSIFEAASVPDASKYSFGIPSKTTTESETSQKPTAIIYDAPKMSIKTDGPLSFNLKTKEESNPTPQAEAPNTLSAGKESGFGFVFKTTASKSPTKSPHKQGDDSEDDDLVKEEDCGAHFNPVIPLPDKVEVITEEKEEELYGHRAKLYMYVSGEWKERGTGIVKILKHKETSKLRVIMRREQVLKICLNHALTADITYTLKDNKTWLFAANDFSDGELILQRCCLRFGNKEVATQFKNAVDNALQGKPVDVKLKSETTKSDEKIDDDVVFVSETQASAEDKQKAKELMLPENFYTYKEKEACHGCRGCSDDEKKSDTQAPGTMSVSEVAAALAKQNGTQGSLVTPLKAKLPTLQSPTNSIYGTPGNDKTFDTSVFRTPLGSIGSNTVASTPTNNSGETGNDGTNKENLFAQKPSIFSNFGEQRSIFGTPQSSSFGAGDSQTPVVSTKSSLLAPPKLSALDVSSDKQTTEVKSIFSSGPAKPAFGESSIFGAGISSNKSIFGFAVDKPKDESSPEVKSIFGGNETSVNLFSGASQGSIFGPGSLNTNQPKPGAITFGSGGSLFGSAALSNPTNETKNELNKFSTIWGPIPSDPKPVNELPLKLENNLSFAALLTGEPLGFEKQADFKWEGTGQQLFTPAQKKDSKNKSGAGDESGDVGEEFDPHYEPIVPLPEKIVVTTGEEDEQKIFGERGKIFRYDEKNKEWKERGVGEIKILHHPQNKTYRLLLRREQVHKAVLNMLLHQDIDLLPMKNTETAWTFAGCNFAENPSGQYEMLAVRFKNADLANNFRDIVNQCVRALQVAAATAIREEKEAQEKKEATPAVTVEKESAAIAPLRLPKHLQDNARADMIFAAAAQQAATPAVTVENESGAIAPLRLPKHLQDNARADMIYAAAAQQAETAVSAKLLWTTATQPKTETKPNGGENTFSEVKQVNFRKQEEHDDDDDDDDDEDDDDDDENYEDHDYDQSDYYYNEEEAYYACEGEAIVQQGEDFSTCPHASIQVLYDQDICSPKILVTDADTGEILADMLIHTDTEFQMSGDSCKWTGTDYTSNEAVDKTVTINFYESESAMQFYDSVETSKHATFTTSDPDPE